MLFSAHWYLLPCKLIRRNPFSNGTNFIALQWHYPDLLIGFVSGFSGQLVMRRLRTHARREWMRKNAAIASERERLRAIYELTSTLTATLSYKRVLDSALDLGYTALNPNPDPDEPNVDERLVSADFYLEATNYGSARRGVHQCGYADPVHGNEGILKRVFDDGEAALPRISAMIPNWDALSPCVPAQPLIVSLYKADSTSMARCSSPTQIRTISTRTAAACWISSADRR